MVGFQTLEDPSMNAAPPHKFGRYEVQAEIGSGAMGVVYRGYDPDIGRDVAIKTTKRSLDLPPNKRREYLERFQREARVAGRLSDHPHIVPVFDRGQEGELPYIIMAFVEGTSLDRVRRRTRIEGEALQSLMGDICSALSHAHSEGVIHRDVKPANVIMTKRGAMLTDFGIARLDDSDLTRAGAFLGSPSYMSPEQIRGEDIDGRSDLFSLAVVLYLLLTGQKPFPANDTNGILYKIVNEAPEPPSSVRGELARWDAFFERALAKIPAQRFPDAEGFYQAFVEVHATEGGSETAPTSRSSMTEPTFTPPRPAPTPSARAAYSPEESAPARPAPQRARYDQGPELRENPLADNSVFFNVDMKDQIPSRRSGSRTDPSWRLSRVVQGASGPRQGAGDAIPLPVWIGLVGIILFLTALVVYYWPEPTTDPAADRPTIQDSE